MSETFKAAADYASRGWRVLPVYGLIADGVCSCTYGPGCATPGKHPVMGGWQKVATTDEATIEGWFEDEYTNVGVALGRESGIVDIEWDDEEGKATAIEYGVVAVETPTYISSRSEHRIFKFSDALPEQAVLKFKGLEIRIGGGGRGSQSVFPPSKHASGVKYRWKEGFSPEDIPVAEIPARLMEAINAGSRKSLTPAPRATEILFTGVSEGDRHKSMVRWLGRACVTMMDCHDLQEQQVVLETALVVNQTKFNPPLGRAEVENIWRGMVKWAIAERAKTAKTANEWKKAIEEKAEYAGHDTDAEFAVPSADYAMSGLKYDGHGSWLPGTWSLEIVRGEPSVYYLSIPTTAQGVVSRIKMNAETFASASLMAKAVFAATGTVFLEKIPGEWQRIWVGTEANKKKGTEATIGLRARLVEAAVVSETDESDRRTPEVAGWLLDAFGSIVEPDPSEIEDGTPDPLGAPQWVRNAVGEWELWVNWSRIWEKVASVPGRVIYEGERLNMRREIEAIAGRMKDGMHRGEGGTRKRYLRLTGKHVRAIEQIAGAGGSGVESSDTVS